MRRTHSHRRANTTARKRAKIDTDTTQRLAHRDVDHVREWNPSAERCQTAEACGQQTNKHTENAIARHICAAPVLNLFVLLRRNTHSLIHDHFGGQLSPENSTLHGAEELLRRPVARKGEVGNGGALLRPKLVATRDCSIHRPMPRFITSVPAQGKGAGRGAAAGLDEETGTGVGMQHCNRRAPNSVQTPHTGPADYVAMLSG